MPLRTKLSSKIDVSGDFTGGASTLIIFGLLLAGFFTGQFAGAIGALILAFANGLTVDQLTDDLNMLVLFALQKYLQHKYFTL